MMHATALSGDALSAISEIAIKVIDSGMPDETYWNSLFDVAGIVSWLTIGSIADPIVEIGCR